MFNKRLKGLENVVAHVRRGLGLQAGASVFFLLLGTLTVTLCANAGSGHPVEMILAMLPWLPGLAFAGAALHRANALRSPLVQCLLDHPQRIVWVFADEIEGRSHRNVFLQTAGGGSFVIPAVEPYALPALMRALRRRLPHASWGYTEEVRVRYGTNPKLVVRAVEEGFNADIVTAS